MNHRSADEYRNSSRVFGQAAKRQREKRVCCTETNHNEANTMDTQWARHERLNKKINKTKPFAGL